MSGRGLFIEGHAIVSAEGAIADADGSMPASLVHRSDQVRFQASLDAADLVVLGRLGHEANPNRRRRHRLVVSGAGRGLERLDAVTHRLNPADLSFADAFTALLPAGGRVAVVGGRCVFDAFLKVGYDEFHLAVASRARIPGGRPVFTGIASVADAEARLSAAGLRVAEQRVLDAQAGVVLVVWARETGLGDTLDRHRPT